MKSTRVLLGRSTNFCAEASCVSKMPGAVAKQLGDLVNNTEDVHQDFCGFDPFDHTA